MSSKSKIEWTDATWNPVTGCTKVSAGCKNCYAERISHRFGKDFSKIELHEQRLDAPLKWRKPRMVFVNSMSDLFHKDVPVDFIDKVFAVMALCPQHTFQVLTKRPERMAKYLTGKALIYTIDQQARNWDGHSRAVLEWHGGPCLEDRWPFPNVWLGTSVEDQAAADERIPHLLKCPAAVRFLSVEPMLGPVDLSACIYPNSCGCLEPHIYVNPKDCPHCKGTGAVTAVDWVIVGGESGPGARPMQEEWARSVMTQCKSAGVPFFMKQGSQANWPRFKDFDSFPQDLQVREWPQKGESNE